MAAAQLTPDQNEIGQQVIHRLLKLWKSGRRPTPAPSESTSYQTLEHHTVSSTQWCVVRVLTPGGVCVIEAVHNFDEEAAQILGINALYCREVFLPVLDRALVLQDMAEI